MRKRTGIALISPYKATENKRRKATHSSSSPTSLLHLPPDDDDSGRNEESPPPDLGETTITLNSLFKMIPYLISASSSTPLPDECDRIAEDDDDDDNDDDMDNTNDLEDGGSGGSEVSDEEGSDGSEGSDDEKGSDEEGSDEEAEGSSSGEEGSEEGEVVEVEKKDVRFARQRRQGGMGRILAHVGPAAPVSAEREVSAVVMRKLSSAASKAGPPPPAPHLVSSGLLTPASGGSGPIPAGTASLTGAMRKVNALTAAAATPSAVRSDEFRSRISLLEKELDEFEKKGKDTFTGATMREKILLLRCDMQSKSTIMARYKEVHSSSPLTFQSGSSESSKAMQWLHSVLEIPFGICRELPVKLENGFGNSLNIVFFLRRAKSELDRHIWGHRKAKEEILGYLCRLVTCPEKPSSTVLALHGPPGVGKTRLCRSALAACLDLPFFSINCGGIRESSFFIGHTFTYLGSRPGRIAQIMTSAKSSNFVLLLDEVDKISSEHSREIFGCLTHLLDPESNTQFEDLYFSGVHLNLSRVLFVLSFNNIDAVDVVAKDRMLVIKIEGMTIEEKAEVGLQHIWKEMAEELKLEKHVTCDVKTMVHLVKKTPTADEKCGVRDVKRIIKQVLERLNVVRLVFEHCVVNEVVDEVDEVVGGSGGGAEKARGGGDGGPVLDGIDYLEDPLWKGVTFPIHLTPEIVDLLCKGSSASAEEAEMVDRKGLYETMYS